MNNYYTIGDRVRFTVAAERPESEGRFYEGIIKSTPREDRVEVVIIYDDDLVHLNKIYGKGGTLTDRYLNPKVEWLEHYKPSNNSNQDSDFKLCFELETLIDMISSRINTSNFSIAKVGEEYGIIVGNKTIVRQSLFACLKEIENESRI